MDLKVLLARPFKPVKAVFRASWNELTDDEFTYVVYLWEPRHKSWIYGRGKSTGQANPHKISLGKHGQQARAGRDCGMGSSSSPKISIGHERLLQHFAALLLHQCLSAPVVSWKSSLITQPGCTYIPRVHHPSGFPYTTPAVCLCCTHSAAQQNTGAPASVLFTRFARASVFSSDSKTHLLKFPCLLQGGSFLCYRKGRENRKLPLIRFSKKDYITAQPQFLTSYATAQSAYSQQLLKLRTGPLSPQNCHVISYCWVRTQCWISVFCVSVYSPCCSNCAYAYVQAMQRPLCMHPHTSGHRCLRNHLKKY